MSQSTDVAMDGWTAFSMVSEPEETGADFAALLRRHGDRVYNFAYRLAGNASDAADLVQEAFAKAFEARDRYDPTKAFDSWVMSILHNVFIDGVRRYEKRNAVSMDAPVSDGESGGWAEVLPGPDPDPQESVARDEDGDLAQRALDALPPPYRAAVVMCDVEGMTYEEIASVSGCPVGTVRSRLHQGRLLLKEAFGRLGGRTS